MCTKLLEHVFLSQRRCHLVTWLYSIMAVSFFILFFMAHGINEARCSAIIYLFREWTTIHHSGCHHYLGIYGVKISKRLNCWKLFYYMSYELADLPRHSCRKCVCAFGNYALQWHSNNTRSCTFNKYHSFQTGKNVPTVKQHM